MKYWYQALSAPTSDTPGSSFILCYPNRKYVFGHVSEGLQRSFTERAQSYTNLTDFFVTGKTSWDNLGGLLGMILTIADSRANAASSLALEKEEKRARKQQNQDAAQPSSKQPDQEEAERSEALTIHGGKNINHTLGTARRFIFRKSTPVRVREYESETLAVHGSKSDPFDQPTWSDENIKVWVLPLQSDRGTIKSFGFGANVSPRKRTLNEVEEEEDENVAPLDVAARNKSIRESIVKNMFDSSWTLDALHEVRLRDLKPPFGVIYQRMAGDLIRYTGPLPGGQREVPNEIVYVRKPWPAALVEALPQTTPATESLCYIVRGHDQRGKFDPKKAMELNVPKGPAFAELTRGISYTTKEGKVVTPDMVLGDPRPGRGVVFADIPSSDYIKDFVSRDEWNSPAVTCGLSVFVWILGPGVGEDQRIRDFIARMSHCEHVMSSTDYCPNQIAMHTAAKSTLRLASINKDNFVVPYFDNVTLPQPGTGSDFKTIRLDDQPWTISEPGLILDMEPEFKINKSAILPPFDPLQQINRMPKAVKQRLDKIQSKLRKPYFIDKIMDMRYKLPELGAETEVFTLGTGSSSPSRYRNVSATLLNVPGKGYYLLDAGENTLGQLKRTFTPEELRHVMKNLRMIWISHLHADHHLGATSVIKEWYKAHRENSTLGSVMTSGTTESMLQQKRLFILGESSFIQWLEEYAGVEDFGFGAIMPLAVHSKEGPKTVLSHRNCRPDGFFPEGGAVTQLAFEDNKYASLLQNATGLKKLEAVWVNHCRGSMAVSLTWDQGFKVSYSGDCRPSENFVKIGKRSTLLIHEATFQDDMQGSAIAKKHCTTSEAIKVGKLMGAHMTILTHFSQRYAKVSSGAPDPSAPFERGNIPEHPKELDVPDNEDLHDSEPDISGPGDFSTAEDYDMPVCTAYDYMKVKIRDIPIAQMFSPAFEKLVQRLDQAATEADRERRKADERSRKINEEKKKLREARRKQLAPKANKKGAAPTEPVEPVELAEPMETEEDAEAKKPSAWSASESESGWTLSESENESEDEKEKGDEKAEGKEEKDVPTK